MAPITTKGTRSVAKSYQIQAFRIIFFYHSHSTYRGCVGNNVDPNGAGDFPAFYLWRCFSYFGALPLYHGSGDVNAGDWF